jgi:hypothetical protein
MIASALHYINVYYIIVTVVHIFPTEQLSPTQKFVILSIYLVIRVKQATHQIFDVYITCSKLLLYIHIHFIFMSTVYFLSALYCSSSPQCNFLNLISLTYVHNIFDDS